MRYLCPPAHARAPQPAQGRNGRSAQRGLTLIELLAVVAILALLAAGGATLGLSWVRGGRLTQAQGLLQQGYSVTKAYALQNPGAQTGASPAAVMCFSGSSITVYAGPQCSGTALWYGSLPAQVSLSMGMPATTPRCVALTNMGTPASAAGPLSCSTSLSYTLASGASNVSKQLF